MNRRCEIKAGRLQCEDLENPIGIDVLEPRLSWVIKCLKPGLRNQAQTAFQIQVGSTPGDDETGCNNIWDSGKVESADSAHLLVIDRSFSSGERCWWRVRVWDQNDTVSEYSKPAFFEFGLLEPSDWQGSWIGGQEDISAPLFRKTFELTKTVDSARVYIVGLGYHELYINGEKVGDHVLDPAMTYYDHLQSREFHPRVFYVTHDVSRYIVPGVNVIGVILGHGWYSLESDIQAVPDQDIPFGDRQKLLLQLNLEDQDGPMESIWTDDSWQVSDGPIRYNDFSHGECYDARLEKTGWSEAEFDDPSFSSVLIQEAPEGKLEAQMIPPEKVMETIAPVGISRSGEGSHIFDFGICMTGWVRLRVTGPRGTEVSLLHAQTLLGDGNLDRRSNMMAYSPARQTDTYILKGEGEEIWEPRFTLHGFRYVEVKGFPGTPTLESLEGCFVRSALLPSGRFSCSNPLLNRIHENVCRTFASSFHGIPQDASERGERWGWLGDPGFVAEDYMYTFACKVFWTKWLRDIRDSQKHDGDIPVVSPFFGPRGVNCRYFSFIPAWKSTYPLFAWFLYQYYGDIRVLEEHFDGLKALVDFLKSKADGYILRDGLGDHMEPQEHKSHFSPLHTPPVITSTAYFYFDTWIVSQAARILQKEDEADHYLDLAARIKDAFNAEFFDSAKNSFATGSQTSNALALYLGLAPQDREGRVLENLLHDILVSHLGHLSTGIIGTNALQQALPKFGRADVMYAIANKTTFPSWGYQIMRGATTVWETWDGDPNKCWNMKMFCSIEKFLFGNLAGVSPGAPGYESIILKPCVVGDLKYVRAGIDTPRGVVEVNWKREQDTFLLKVLIPPNTGARISVPTLGLSAPEIVESGTVIWKDGYVTEQSMVGIQSLVEENEYVTFQCGSGTYEFKVTSGIGGRYGITNYK